MKKKAFAVVCCAALAAASVPAMAADKTISTGASAMSSVTVEQPEKTETNEIKVIANGAAVSFDQQPVIQEGRTLVPLRAVLEAIHANVTWIPESKTVYIQRGNTALTLTIGSNTVAIDDMLEGEGSVALDVPAQIIGDRTLIPLRAVCEALGAQVGWDEATRTITVTDTGVFAIMGIDTLTQDVKAADGTTLVKVSVQYPQVVASVANAEAINATLKAQAEAAVESVLPDMKATAEELRNIPDHTFEPVTITGVCVPTYATTTLLSYFSDISTYAGGAHPMTVRTGYILDRTTGQSTTLSAATGLTEEALTAAAKKLFAADIDAHSDLYFEEAKTTLESKDFTYGAYLTQAIHSLDGEDTTRVAFFAQLYTLRPYAGGIPVVHAPLSSLK